LFLSLPVLKPPTSIMRQVHSRFAAGIGAWVLGAVTATTASMITVGQLAHGMLSPQGQVLTGAKGGANPDGGNPEGPTPSATSAGTSPSGLVAPVQHSSPAPAPGATAPQSVAPALLTSADGSALASCQSGGAYLIYWSPDPGYTADDVTRGPAPVASVTFSSRAGADAMRVSCRSGMPVAHVFPVSPSPSASRTDE